MKVQDGNRPAVLQQRSQHRIGHYPPVRLSPNLIGQKQVIVPLPSVTNDARIAAQDGGGPPVQSKLLELDLGMEVAAWIEGQREKATLPTFDLAQFSAALGELEQILGRSRYAGQASKSAAPASALYHQRQPSSSHRKRQASSSQLRKLYREPSGHASDTDYFQDGELLVPTVDASLDDSSHDTAESDKSTPTSGRFVFKREVVRLIHTLGIRHWRRLPLEQSDDVEIPRISGALTNAVYVVSLPKSKLHSSGSRDLQTDQAYSESTSAKSRGPPYGSPNPVLLC